VQQLGEPNAGRYRLATWLNDGKRLVAVNDAEGQETLVIINTDGLEPPQRLEKLDLSRIVGLKPSPVGDHVLVSNVRNELILVDLASKTTKVLDRSEHSFIFGFDFSPDGKWVAYSWAPTLHTSIIKLCRLDDGQRFQRHPAGVAGHRAIV
jgi:tricorn protease